MVETGSVLWGKLTVAVFQLAPFNWIVDHVASRRHGVFLHAPNGVEEQA